VSNEQWWATATLKMAALPLSLLVQFIGVGAGSFLGQQGIFCPNFPRFARKTIMCQTFPFKFSVAVDTLHFLDHVATYISLLSWN